MGLVPEIEFIFVCHFFRVWVFPRNSEKNLCFFVVFFLFFFLKKVFKYCVRNFFLNFFVGVDFLEFLAFSGITRISPTHHFR